MNILFAFLTYNLRALCLKINSTLFLKQQHKCHCGHIMVESMGIIKNNGRKLLKSLFVNERIH